MKIQSGLIRRTCSHVDFCSWPGVSTGSSESSKPYLRASSSRVGLASLPYGLLWKTWTIFLPFSLSSPPSWAPTYLMKAEAWLQYVIGKLKTHGNQRPSAEAVMPYPDEWMTTLSTGALGISAYV